MNGFFETRRDGSTGILRLLLARVCTRLCWRKQAGSADELRPRGTM